MRYCPQPVLVQRMEMTWPPSLSWLALGQDVWLPQFLSPFLTVLHVLRTPSMSLQGNKGTVGPREESRKCVWWWSIASFLDCTKARMETLWEPLPTLSPAQSMVTRKHCANEQILQKEEPVGPSQKTKKSLSICPLLCHPSAHAQASKYRSSVRLCICFEQTT